MSFEQFRQLIASITHIPIERIQTESSFRDDLGIDSLQMVNLLVELTGEVGISLENITRSSDFATPGSLYSLIIGGV